MTKTLVSPACASLCMLVVAISLSPAYIVAQAQPKVLTNPAVHTPVHFDVSPPLRDMATQATSQPGGEVEHPVLYPKLQQLMQAAQQGQKPVADGALQTTVGQPVSASIGLNLLGVGNGFPGYTVPDAPSDVNLAVGDTQVLQWVNVSYAVFDKNTGAIIQGPILGNSLWAGFGGLCQSDNSGDIIAQWDKIAHRWVLTQNTFQSGFMTCVAISTTSDATGSYYRFAFSQPGLPDYPKWGVWPDAYYQSQNNFGPYGAAFVGAYACAYERAKMLVGDSTAKQICFQTGTFDDSLLPGDLDSAASLPPSGEAEVYLGSIDNGSTTRVYQYLFHVDFTNPSHSTFTGVGGTMPITVASFSLACGGSGACIPQPSPGENLYSLGDRLMYRLAYRNFSGNHQTWLVSHSVTAGSSVGERWYEFRAPESSTTLSVYQQGTFAPDSKFRWMGSIAMDQNQNIILGYSVSSSSVFPSISYTGRAPTDPLGTMQSEASIVAGAGSQVYTYNRWGDYTSMAVDEANDCTMWYTNEYYMSTASFDWSTRLASLKFSGCGSTTPDFSLTASPSSRTVVQGGSTSYTVTASPLNNFRGTVNLTVSGCPANTTCTLNPTSLTLPPAGNSTLSVQTTSTTPTGTYSLTVTGKSGTLTHGTTVTLVVSSSSGQIAVYNSTLKAPECATVGSSCDSGPSLLLGRDTMSGGAEPHQPNTINNSCADGTTGTFHSDESNDRIVVASTNGGPLTHGTTATVTATVWAWSGFTSDALDLYYAANANSPSWVLIKTIVPNNGGPQSLSATFTLPTGALQAVRAQFRYQGSASACTVGPFNDHDDLIFAVK